MDQFTLSLETPRTLGDFVIPSTTIRPTVEPSERVAVVTGANQGLGFGIVKGLCEQFDGYIYLTARDKKKGREAVQALKDMKACKYPDKLRFHELNILNQDHMEDLVFHLKEKHGGIDILVNNAAIAYKRDSRVSFAEQAENTIRTNYVALVRTCVFLFPLLRRHGRVVNLSSSAGHLSQVSHFELKKRLMDDHLNERRLTNIMYEFMDMTKEHPKAHVQAGWPDSAYAVSKIGVNLLTKIYQEEFDCMLGNQDLVINAVHPGYVATNMSSFMGNVNIFDAAERVIEAALLPPFISEPRGRLIWDTGDWIDMDSPTTPETNTNIYEYDIIEDLRHYNNYTTTSQLPNIAEEMNKYYWGVGNEGEKEDGDGTEGKKVKFEGDEVKVEAKIGAGKEKEGKGEHSPGADNTHARGKKGKQDASTTHAQRSSFGKKGTKSGRAAREITDQNIAKAMDKYYWRVGDNGTKVEDVKVTPAIKPEELPNIAEEMEKHYWGAGQAAGKETVNEGKPQGNKSGRPARAATETTSLPYRTVTRGTLPEEYCSSFVYWCMTHRFSISTLPPPRA